MARRRRAGTGRGGPRRSIAGLTTVALVSAVLVLGAPAAEAEPCVDPFTPSFRSEISAAYPNQRVTAAVYDTRTGCWFHLNRGMRIETASVIKAQFLAGVLLRAQAAGRGLTGYETSRIGPMMTYSFNPEASELFTSLGGVDGLEAIDRRFGLTATTHTNRWGATVTTAEDRTRLAVALLGEGGPLREPYRAMARYSMLTVHGSQQWGISAGVPAGWSVALKNGFFPTTGTPAWRIGSTGFVRDELTGEGYAITVMSDRNPNHVHGQRLVEAVSKQVSTVLTTGDSAPRLVDRSRCVTARSGESWSQVAARIGGTDPAGTRTASGGTTNPIGGMRACAPDFSAPPGPDPRSTINGVYLPFTGDFDGNGATDVFWYRPGGGADYVWYGQPGGTFTSTRVDVSGTYQPLVGDFDANDTDDILWYRPGTGSDHLWPGRPDGTFGDVPTNIAGHYAATVADLNGDGRDDIVWNGPGGGSDSSWIATGSPGFTSQPESIPGVQRPVVGDLDGDPEIEILYYGPGAETEILFDGDARRSRPVIGRYETLTGDFDGDGTGDVLFYGRGGAPDSMWLGTADAASPRSVQPRTG